MRYGLTPKGFLQLEYGKEKANEILDKLLIRCIKDGTNALIWNREEKMWTFERVEFKTQKKRGINK